MLSYVCYHSVGPSAITRADASLSWYDITRYRLISYAADRVLSYVCHDTLRYDIIPYACATE